MKQQLSYRDRYLLQVNRWWAMGVVAHLPVAVAIAWWFGTGMLFSLVVAAAIAAGPIGVWLLGGGAIIFSLVNAVAAMALSALLIALAGGMIEFHFHIFVMLALLIVFGRWWPIVAAAAVIAIHHIAFWIVFPDLVFNYDAPFGVVLLHAAFVVFQTIPSCLIADRFGRFIAAQGTVDEQLRTVTPEVAGNAGRLQQSMDIHLEAFMSMVGQCERMTQQGERAQSDLKQAVDDADGTADRMRELDRLARDSQQRIATLTASIERVESHFAQTEEQADSLGHEVRDATTAMSELGVGADKVSEIVQVIGRIAEKTNLLALNASIEASSAGEAGRSFAVVADEIKALAAQSARSAGDIAERIDVMRESVKRVDHSVASVRDVADNQRSALKEVASVVPEQRSALTAAASSASTMADHVADSTTSLSDVSTAIHRGAEAVSVLAQLAEELERRVSVLQQEAESNKATASAVARESERLDQLSQRLHVMVAFRRGKDVSEIRE